MKKIITIIATFLICMVTFGCGSGCGCGKPNTVSDEYFIYTELDDGTYSIGAKDKTNLPEDLVIPMNYNGKLITKITESGFFNCDGILSVKISKKIKSISESGFAQCDNLLYVEIPLNVTGFGRGAFGGCKSLVTIAYDGTKAQWKSIMKAGNWDVNTKIYTVYCKDGSIEG